MNNASPGDTIIVGPGTYTENININKNDLVIRSSEGPESTIIVASNLSEHVINIRNRNNVTIKGLKVANAGAEKAGIYLTGSQDCTIEGNILYNNAKDGISLYFSSENTISGNMISHDTLSSNTHSIFLNNSHNNNLQSNAGSNCDYGIAMRYSNSNNLTNNSMSNNNRGIYLALTSTRNTLSNNQANSNSISGIVLNNCNNNSLVNNTARLNIAGGIVLGSASYNTLTNNNASENSKGIQITSSSSGNTIVRNIANSNNRGIELDHPGSYNNITINTVDSNHDYGIYLVNSSNNDVFSNIAPHNPKGIYLLNSSENTLSNNMISDNTQEGIMLHFSDRNILSGNIVSNNGYGIALNSCGSNIISSNTINSSNNYGISMCPRSSNNQIVNNYFNNTMNTYVRHTANTWNTAKTAGKNIAGGPNLGGNFWGTPAGTGHSQTEADNNGDGFTDNIFSVGNVTDNLPLVAVYTPEPVNPVANFTTNVTQGYAPLSVLFTDLSQDATSRSWDVNGDGVEDSNEAIFVYVYAATGTYAANLTVSNENDTDSKTAVITVLEKEKEGNETNIFPVADFTVNKTSGYYPLTVLFTDTSQNATSRSWDVNGDGVEDSNEAIFVYTYTSRGTYTAKLTAINGNNTATQTKTIDVERKSSGGSGGGGGGSPESSKNIEVKEISQVFVTNGKAIQFDFTKKATCVVYVGFDSKKTAGKITTIAEQLKNKSSLVSELPEGEVYKSFNLWVGNSGFATSKNIENPVICFKVEKAWVQDKKIDQSSITLNRYSDKKWERLPASLSDEDDKYLYFTAEVPGFSSFAITGIADTSEETVAEIQPEDESDNSEENTENTGSEADQEPEQEDSTGMPGFGTVYGIAGLLAVFLYRRK